jgi:hypothetical protein
MIGVLGIASAPADIMVTLFPADAVIDPVGATTTVDIMADIPEVDAILGWGLDLLVADPGIAGITNVAIGPLFNAAYAADGDELAGLAFPDCVWGPDVLLATVTFTGYAFGITDTALGATEGDLTEGFALCGSGFAPAVYGDGTVRVIPEPASLTLLALGLLVLRRR